MAGYSGTGNRKGQRAGLSYAGPPIIASLLDSTHQELFSKRFSSKIIRAVREAGYIVDTNGKAGKSASTPRNCAAGYRRGLLRSTGQPSLATAGAGMVRQSSSNCKRPGQAAKLPSCVCWRINALLPYSLGVRSNVP